MGFNKTMLAASVTGILLSALAAGCSSSFSRRVANSMAVCIDVQNDPNVRLANFWRSEKELYLLQAAPCLIKTNGIIAYVTVMSLNKEGRKSFWVCYLARNADVKEIVVTQGRSVVLSFPPPTRNFAKHLEKDIVAFGEQLIWNSPTPLDHYDARELSVTLVRENGKIIGPSRILTDKEVWEEIRARMLVEKRWQTKFPWLHDQLIKDPAMGPMWFNPTSDHPPAKSKNSGSFKKAGVGVGTNGQTSR